VEGLIGVTQMSGRKELSGMNGQIMGSLKAKENEDAWGAPGFIRYRHEGRKELVTQP
jgi:hypothetical protein